MSDIVVALVWTSTMSDATEVAVLSCLASHCNDFGESCFAGIPRIAKLTRRSERTIQRTLQDLEDGGWLKIQRGLGKGNLTHYILNVDQLKGCQDVTLLPANRKVTLRPQKVTLTPAKGDIDANPPHPLFGVSKKASKKQLPPQPPAARGASGGDERRQAIDRGVDQVVSALGVVPSRRERQALASVVELEAEKGQPPPTIALAMIAAYREQGAARNRGELTASFGVIKFFTRGVWKSQGRWHWNEELLRQRSLAGVGSR